MNSFEMAPQPESDPKMESVKAQRQTMLAMKESGVPFVLWGSWAAKAQGVYPEEYQPNDVDIFTSVENIGAMREFMEGQGFVSSDDKEKATVSFEKPGTMVDSHLYVEEGDYYVEHAPHGTFYFPKEGFFEREGYTMITPELMYVMESGGPFRKGKEEKLVMVGKAVDEEKLKIIQTKFRYEPADESEE